MSPEELEDRFAAIERRMSWLETAILNVTREGRLAPERMIPPPPAERPGPSRIAAVPRDADERSVVGAVLGWGGGVALVLAAAYLIRLGVDSGWLTPARQVGLAALFGLVLIGLGLALRGQNLSYAGLLPAVGIAILFLSIYGGHLYHHIFGQKDAGLAVIAVCAASLWLCRVFQSDLYAFFAVLGSYSAPFLLSSANASLVDLAIYFSAWSVVFCVFSLWQGRRSIYLWALYLALIGFDVIWRAQNSEEWIAALVFQAAQFAIFAATTALFSLRHHEPLDPSSALAHLPPLLLFYVLQYSLLAQHLAPWAPWIAVASLALVAVLYAGARARLRKPLPGGELIVWGYAAVVLLHAGYVESVPRQWQPWVALFAVPIIALAARRGTMAVGTRWPIWVAIGIVFAANYLRIVSGGAAYESVPARHLLAVAYALLLYGGYWLLREQVLGWDMKGVLLYLGHICAMAAAIHIVQERIIESTIWGAIAVGSLGLSLRWKDRLLRQSSLAVFGVTAGKVLLFDLRDASPVARIVGLLVLGFTFYFGGLLYQRLLGEAKQP